MTRFLTISLSFLLYLLFVLAPNFSLASTIIVQTNSQTELRSEPNGKVLVFIPTGTIGVAQQLNPPWIKVYFGNGTNDPSIKDGWVIFDQINFIDTVASGDDCETDYDTNAEVCVTVDDASLDFYTGYNGFYSSCEVEIEYTLETDLDQDDKYISVEIECEAEISYKRQDRFNSSDYDDDDESHTLYSQSSDSGEIDIDFSFSSFEEVYSVQLEIAECEIDSVYSY